MPGLIAFLISGALGYYVLRCFKGRDRSFDPTDIFLMTGLGLGISSQIMFYTLMLCGHYDPIMMIGAHLLCLCALFFYCRRYLSNKLPVFSFEPRPAMIIFGILVLVAVLAAILALMRPWGDWDGWSYWNYRASFFFSSGYEWPRMFELNMQGQHPWMLPLTILWGWSFCGSQQAAVGMAIGVIFTVSTVGLLIGALKRYVPLFWAVLAGIFLASLPIYLSQGTDQYADIEAAYFILLSSVSALDLLRSPSVNSAGLAGICLGLTATVKDNSVIAALILLVLMITRLYRSRSQVLIKPLIWGFVSVGVSVVVMKTYEIFLGHNHPYGIYWPGLWQWQRWALIGRSIVRACTALSWGGSWSLALAVLIVQRDKWLRKEIGLLVQFLFIYTIFYFIIFALSAVKLEWLLRVTFDRTLFILAPTVIFVMFYTAVGKG